MTSTIDIGGARKNLGPTAQVIVGQDPDGNPVVLRADAQGRLLVATEGVASGDIDGGAPSSPTQSSRIDGGTP